MYELIEFDNTSISGGGLSVVHNTWLTPRKTEVYWPPYKELNKFNKAVKEGEPIDETNWKLYNIERRFYSCDDFEKINKKLKEAEETSDLLTDAENHIRLKRRTVKARKIFESTDEEDEVDWRKETLSRPPRILIAKEKKDHISCATKLSNSGVCNSEKRCALPALNINRTPSNLPLQTNVLPAPEVYTTPSKSTVTLEEVNPQLLTLLTHIKEQNDVIISLLENKVTSGSTTLPSDFPVELPVKSIEALNTIEEYLQNKQQHFSYFVSFLVD